MSKLIKLNKKNIHLVEVVINRPEKLNAMTKPMWMELGKIFKKLSKNKNLRCIIIRGKGGSETLKNTLGIKNQVDYLEVYERVQCELTFQHSQSFETFMNYSNGVLMATSEESLVNIVRLVHSISVDFIQILLTKKIIVFSERLRALAKDHGFKNIEVTENPSDEDLVNLLVNN